MGVPGLAATHLRGLPSSTLEVAYEYECCAGWADRTASQGRDFSRDDGDTATAFPWKGDVGPGPRESGYTPTAARHPSARPSRRCVDDWEMSERRGELPHQVLQGVGGRRRGPNQGARVGRPRRRAPQAILANSVAAQELSATASTPASGAEKDLEAIAKIIGNDRRRAARRRVKGDTHTGQRFAARIATRFAGGMEGSVNVNLRPFYGAGAKTVDTRIAEELGLRNGRPTSSAAWRRAVAPHQDRQGVLTSMAHLRRIDGVADAP